MEVGSDTVVPDAQNNKDTTKDKRERKISIVLPPDENKKKGKKRDDATNNHRPSVTSYVISNPMSRRRSSALSIQTSTRGRSKFNFGPLDVTKEKVEKESDRCALKGSTGTSPTISGSPRSVAWSARERMGSTRLTKIPIVAYQRLTVSSRKKHLSYSDLNLIRCQMRRQEDEFERKRFTRDYKRTTSDIYRMKLVCTEKLNAENETNFRSACVTYLGTSPGAKRAVLAQFD